MNDRLPELIILLSLAAVFFAWRWWTVWRVVQLRKSLMRALADAEKKLPPSCSENEAKEPPAPPAE